MIMSNKEFYVACRKAKSLQELETLTGYKKNTLNQKRVAIAKWAKANGLPWTEYQRGTQANSGTADVVDEEFLKSVAEAEGITLEVLKERMAAEAAKPKVETEAPKSDENPQKELEAEGQAEQELSEENDNPFDVPVTTAETVVA